MYISLLEKILGLILMLEIWKYVECFINKSRKMVMLPANLYIYKTLSFFSLSLKLLFVYVLEEN